MPTIAVVGTQWGDEGKGKLVDLLSEHAGYIIRSQGGDNAGHTIKVGNEEYKFHLIPSGIIYTHTQCIIGAGTVVDPQSLLNEIKFLKDKNIDFKGRLLLSRYANVVMPYHKLLDGIEEKQRKGDFIGTTGRGIGPCYVDKVKRCGIRICDLMKKDSFEVKLKNNVERINIELTNIYDREPINYNDILDEYMGYADDIRPLVDDVEMIVNNAIDDNKNVLLEGAQGTLLDVTFGTYPYVTSSSTLSSAMLYGCGIGAGKINKVVGVVKAYTTRVGSGPFPTILNNEEEKLFPSSIVAREIGVTTNRVRQMGWFDAVLVSYSIMLNGIDSLSITKLDVLDDVAVIKICVGYRLNEKTYTHPLAVCDELDAVEPIYEEMPGWLCCTKDIDKYNNLPINAKAYIKRIEELCKVPIGIISVGPERDKTIWIEHYFA
jgi:adenylosuccinate synthase